MVVQAAIFGSIAYLFLTDPTAPNISNGAIFILSAAVTFILTVLPVIIYRRGEMLFWKIRHWLEKDEPEKEQSQPARVDPVFTQPLNHGIADRRITGDSRPRIGQ